MLEYRVQEYRLDMGVYSKAFIHHVTHEEYNRVNVFQYRQLVIIPENDWYGETLPRTIRSEKEMTEIRRAHESKSWEARA